jgi:hypothetical protein
MTELPEPWERRDSGVAYLNTRTFELVVRYGGYRHHAFMRANGLAYTIGDDYKDEASAVQAANEYGRGLVSELQELFQ